MRKLKTRRRKSELLKEGEQRQMIEMKATEKREN